MQGRVLLGAGEEGAQELLGDGGADAPTASPEPSGREGVGCHWIGRKATAGAGGLVGAESGGAAEEEEGAEVPFWC